MATIHEVAAALGCIDKVHEIVGDDSRVPVTRTVLAELFLDITKNWTTATAPLGAAATPAYAGNGGGATAQAVDLTYDDFLKAFTDAGYGHPQSAFRTWFKDYNGEFDNTNANDRQKVMGDFKRYLAKIGGRVQNRPAPAGGGNRGGWPSR